MMKRLLIFLFSFFIIITANAQELIGAVNMLTNRTLRLAHQKPSKPEDDDDDDDDDDDRNKNYYELLRKNEGLTDSVLKNNASASIQEALDKTLLCIPCGEFIMNAQIYSYNGKFIVIGDVWGMKRNSCLFKVGDKVSWEAYKAGTIISIKNDKKCLVQDLQTGRQKEMEYKDLFIVSDDFYVFKPGDKVSWRVIGRKYKTGVVISIKDDDDKCLVRDDETGKQRMIEFEDLFRLETSE